MADCPGICIGFVGRHRHAAAAPVDTCSQPVRTIGDLTVGGDPPLVIGLGVQSDGVVGDGHAGTTQTVGHGIVVVGANNQVALLSIGLIGDSAVGVQRIDILGAFGSAGNGGRVRHGSNQLHPALVGGGHIVGGGLSLDADPVADGSHISRAILNQRDGLGRGVDIAVLGQAQRHVGNRGVAVGAVTAGRLQVVQAIRAVTLHGDLGTGDGKDGHGQLFCAGSGVISAIGVITGVPCIHVGEAQGLLGPCAGGTSFCNADLIALGQIDGLAAHVVVGAVGMVVAVQEDDVQAVGTCIIQHVEDVLGVLGIAILRSTGGEGKRQVGHDEDRGRIALADLVVQPGLQVIGKCLNTGLRAAAVRVVNLVQDIGRIVVSAVAVDIHVMTAGSVDAGILIVMVTLYKNGVLIIQIGICPLNGVHKRGDTACGRVYVIVSFAVVVTNEQEPVHCLIFLADLRQDIRYVRRAVSVVSCFLEVAACQNIDRLFSAAARGKYTCRQQ